MGQQAQVFPVDVELGRAGEGQAGHVVHPVKGVGVQLAGPVRNAGIAGELVGPLHAPQQVRHPEAGPLGEGPLVDGPGDVGEIAQHEGQHPLIPGDFLVLGQHLEHDVAGPVVLLGGIGAEIALLVLAIQRPIDEAAAQLHLFPILQIVGQRHEPVQIIGGPLPTLTAAAQPAGIAAHAVPQAVQPPAEAVHLDLQLVLQPALRLDAGQAQPLQ